EAPTRSGSIATCLDATLARLRISAIKTGSKTHWHSTAATSWRDSLSMNRRPRSSTGCTRPAMNCDNGRPMRRGVSSTRRRVRAPQAKRWARHANRLDPDDERSLQRLVRVLDSQGDRAGALRAYTEFAHSLAIEFAAEPSAEIQALIDAVRNRTEAS